MKGLRSDLIPVLTENDASRVKKEATIVFLMEGNKSNGIEILKNPKSRLNVMAVVGPSQAFGRKFKEAVLCEIGIGASRPYHEARKPNSLREEKEPINIPRRRKWFSLSQEQYLAVAPALFQCLQRLTNDKVFRWKTGPHNNNPFFIRSPNNFFAIRNKKLHSKEVFRNFPIGTRYAVSVADKYLLSDIFWADLKLREWQLRKLARFVDKLLSPYRNGGYKRRKSFSKLERTKDVQRIFSTNKYLSKYLLVEMINKYLPRGVKNVFWQDLCDLIKWDCEELLEEHKLVASIYPNPELRLGGINFRITTGLERKKDHIVFEVFPSRNT